MWEISFVMWPLLLDSLRSGISIFLLIGLLIWDSTVRGLIWHQGPDNVVGASPAHHRGPNQVYQAASLPHLPHTRRNVVHWSSSSSDLGGTSRTGSHAEQCDLPSGGPQVLWESSVSQGPHSPPPQMAMLSSSPEGKSHPSSITHSFPPPASCWLGCQKLLIQGPKQV